MMGYFEESKAYRLFDLVKQQIIIMKNVIFDENTSGIRFLNSSFGSSYNDRFGIVEDKGSTVPFMCISSSLLTYVPKSTSSQSTITKKFDIS